MTTSPAPKAEQKPKTPPSFPFWKQPWIWWLGGLLAIALVGGGITTGIAYAQQAKTIVKGTTVLGQQVGAMDSLTAIDTVTKAWTAAVKTGLRFTLNGEEYAVPLDGSADEKTVILDLVGFRPTKAVDRAYAFGHDGPLWRQAWQRLSGYLGRRHEFGTVAISLDDLQGLLAQQLGEFEIAPVNAGLDFDGETTFTVTPSNNGATIDYGSAMKAARRQIRTLSLAPIPLRILSIKPTIADAPKLAALASTEAVKLLDRAPLTLTAGDKKWTIEKKELGGLFGFVKLNGQIIVGIDETKGIDYLISLRGEVEVTPKDAKFSIVNGKVKEFQTSQIGRTIDLPATLAKMDAALRAQAALPVELVIIEEPPVTDTIGANNLGITELVAEGKTNFRGSPVNRRYNLTYGSQILNGLLIKPGETFSLVDALGPIDGQHGWKPELVIKQGGKITPEFGGGLCQVATTLFRAILNAGLPVVERRNHSLRISYYEPPIGLDATIYVPKPDLRFTNDYPGYLLLQTEVVGDELIYRFYGMKDGRKVDIPEPKVYNRTGIPATKTIEVTDLKPGEKVCQSPGHPGADATATYTVTKADGTTVTQVFQSHYTAIGVICRVGKAATKKK